MTGSARRCSPRRCAPRRKHSTRRACSIRAFSLTHDVQAGLTDRQRLVNDWFVFRQSTFSKLPRFIPKAASWVPLTAPPVHAQQGGAICRVSAN